MDRFPPRPARSLSLCSAPLVLMAVMPAMWLAGCDRHEVGKQPAPAQKVVDRLERSPDDDPSSSDASPGEAVGVPRGAGDHEAEPPR